MKRTPYPLRLYCAALIVVIPLVVCGQDRSRILKMIALDPAGVASLEVGGTTLTDTDAEELATRVDPDSKSFTIHCESATPWKHFLPVIQALNLNTGPHIEQLTLAISNGNGWTNAVDLPTGDRPKADALLFFPTTAFAPVSPEFEGVQYRLRITPDGAELSISGDGSEPEIIPLDQLRETLDLQRKATSLIGGSILFIAELGADQSIATLFPLLEALSPLNENIRLTTLE